MPTQPADTTSQPTPKPSRAAANNAPRTRMAQALAATLASLHGDVLDRLDAARASDDWRDRKWLATFLMRRTTLKLADTPDAELPPEGPARALCLGLRKRLGWVAEVVRAALDADDPRLGQWACDFVVRHMAAGFVPEAAPAEAPKTDFPAQAGNQTASPSPSPDPAKASPQGATMVEAARLDGDLATLPGPAKAAAPSETPSQGTARAAASDGTARGGKKAKRRGGKGWAPMLGHKGAWGKGGG